MPGTDTGMRGSIMSSPLGCPVEREVEAPKPAAAQSSVDWAEVGAALRSFLLARTRHPQLAEDIAQESLLRALAFQRENIVGSAYALSFRIAQNLLCEHARRARPTESIDSVDVPCEAPRPEQLHEQRSEMRAALELIQAMPPLRREVFLRRRVEGESCADIGAALGLSPKAVEKHITRALLDLQDLRARATDSGAC
jgi:RNA polymerase sigma-70 factor (ECF subfamily)